MISIFYYQPIIIFIGQSNRLLSYRKTVRLSSRDGQSPVRVGLTCHGQIPIQSETITRYFIPLPAKISTTTTCARRVAPLPPASKPYFRFSSNTTPDPHIFSLESSIQRKLQARQGRSFRRRSRLLGLVLFFLFELRLNWSKIYRVSRHGVGSMKDAGAAQRSVQGPGAGESGGPG